MLYPKFCICILNRSFLALDETLLLIPIRQNKITVSLICFCLQSFCFHKCQISPTVLHQEPYHFNDSYV